eukprot:COSAG01_NODE_440_length_17033_cov_16.301110_4_plen_145_part_00
MTPHNLCPLPSPPHTLPSPRAHFGREGTLVGRGGVVRQLRGRLLCGPLAPVRCEEVPRGCHSLLLVLLLHGSNGCCLMAALLAAARSSSSSSCCVLVRSVSRRCARESRTSTSAESRGVSAGRVLVCDPQQPDSTAENDFQIPN